MALEHIMESVDLAIENVYSEHKGSLDLEIKSVSILLETVVDKSSSQDVTVSILEIEAAEEETITQDVTVSLQPPSKDPGTQPTAAQPAHPSLVKDLEKGIDAAILAAKGAQAGLERIHPGGIPLETKTISVAVTFALTDTGEGIPSITILGINLTGSRSRERVHTVTLTFELNDGSDSSSNSATS
ncbi:MAG: trypco2 family protein [Acidobacteriota bacterium]